MTSSLRRVLRSRRAVGAAAAAGVLLCASLGIDVSLADATADAVDTAASETASANVADTVAGSSGGDAGGAGAPTTASTAPATSAPATSAAPATTARPTSTTVDDFGAATVPSTTAPASTSTAPPSTTTAPPSTTTATTSATTTSRPTTTTRPTTTSQTTTPDYLDGASATVVAPIGGIGDPDDGMLPPPATISVPTTVRPRPGTTAVTQRGALDTATVSKDQPLPTAATGAESLDDGPTTTAPTTATSQPAPTSTPSTALVTPPTEVPRPPATTPLTRTAVEDRGKPLFLIDEIEAVRVGARSDGGTTITLQLWGSNQRIGVELHPSRLPSLWVVWVVIALLLMAFWLPGKGRQPALARTRR